MSCQSLLINGTDVVYTYCGGETRLGAIVRPGAKLHGTVLEVKWEEGYIDGAG